MVKKNLQRFNCKSLARRCGVVYGGAEGNMLIIILVDQDLGQIFVDAFFIFSKFSE